MFRIFIVVLLYLCSCTVEAGPAVIYNGDFVKALKSNLKLKDEARIITGTSDPTSVAVDAEAGSIYIRDNGIVYIKKDNGSTTNWQDVKDGLIDLTSEVTGTLPVANGGTNSTTALGGNRLIYSSGGALVEYAGITANRALATNGTGLPVASAVTDTELGYVSGVTSSIQTQLNGKLENVVEDTTPQLGGNLDLNGNDVLAGVNVFAKYPSNNNTQLGLAAGDTLTTGTNNTAVGYDADLLATNSTNSVVMGYQARAGSYAVSIGTGPTASGNNTISIGNGSQAISESSIMLGVNSGNAAESGTGRNVGIGESALNVVTSGAFNLALGSDTLSSLNTGSYNISVGVSALNGVTGSSYNVGVGPAAGSTISTGAQNTMLGGFADTTTGSVTKSIAIGYQAKVDANNKMRIGGISSADAISVVELSQYDTTLKLDIDSDSNPVKAGSLTIKASDKTNAGATGDAGDLILEPGTNAGSGAEGEIIIGGNVELSGNDILSSSDITLTPTTEIVLDGLSWPTADGNADEVLTTDGAGQLSWSVKEGSVITPWTTFTPNINASHSYTVNFAQWRRVGENMEMRVSWTNTTAPGAENAEIQLPNSLNTLGVDAVVGNVAKSYTGASWDIKMATIAVDSRVIAVTNDDLASGLQRILHNGFSTGTTTQTITASFPVAEWIGSGTLNVGGNQVQYAATSGTWDANSTTTIYGEDGAAMGGALTAARTKTVTFTDNIQKGDKISLQFSEDQTAWTDAGTAILNNFAVVQMTDSNNALLSGAWVEPIAANQVRITFAQYMRAANDDSPTTDWPATNAYWRVVKHKNQQVVAYGDATSSDTGLVLKNRWGSKSTTTSPIASTAVIHSFQNLVVGRTYRLSIQMTSSTAATIDLRANGSALNTVYDTAGNKTYTGNVVFTATTTTADVYLAAGTLTRVGGSQVATLEELNNYEIETTAFD